MVNFIYSGFLSTFNLQVLNISTVVFIHLSCFYTFEVYSNVGILY